MNKAHIILNNDTGESLYAVTLDDPSGFVAANAYKYRYFPYDPQDTADYWLEAFETLLEAEKFIADNRLEYGDFTDTRS